MTVVHLCNHVKILYRLKHAVGFVIKHNINILMSFIYIYIDCYADAHASTSDGTNVATIEKSLRVHFGHRTG
jgi:hypothetical protein